PNAHTTTQDPPEMPNLIISEVADPADNHEARFVELYNAGNKAIVFNTTTIYFSRQANGGNHSSIQLTGVIQPKQTYVIGNSSNISTAYGIPADLDFGSVTGNGDDGYFLYFDGDETTGILMDAYGEIDVQATEADAWFYEDSRALRNSNVTSPNATWTASEWTITAANTDNCTPGEHNENVSWKGGAGNWNNPGNWSNGTIPGNSNNVVIPPGALLNVNVNNAAVNNINLQEGGELTINSGQGLSVSGTIIIEDGGSFINDGTLDNGAKADADAVMQRNVPAYTNDANGWHLLASPVDNMTISGSDFEPGTSDPNLDDFYAWDEINYQWLNFKVGANNITNFENGKGYLVSYQTTATKDFTGTFNNADITLTDLTKTAGKGEGWHLLGNPFQSALKWESTNWNLSNIGTGAKIMNPGGTYTDIAYDGANEYIPANQGFFVQATEATNSITIPTASREHNPTAFYKSEKQNLLTLRAADGEFYVETWIQIMDGATPDYDQNFDIRFLGGMYNAPHLYSLMTDGERLSTNRVGDFEEELVVPLGFKSFLDREFTITASNAASFGNEIEVYLIDSENELQINLKEHPEFTFSANAYEVTERFKLLFLKSTDIHEAESAEKINIYAHGSTVYLNSSENLDARIAIYNITGQMVYKNHILIDRTAEIGINKTTGWYVVKVQTTEGITSQKVFIK
ncbi:MAG: T9SS type A sorting domain-containing protein, partial [Bacteroidales bacterium]